MRFTVGMDRLGNNKIRISGVDGAQKPSIYVLTRDEARNVGKALICMADLADELDKEEAPVCQINLGRKQNDQ